MALALFDLDNTLLQGDSDYLWGEFLCHQGVVDKDHYEERNLQFYQQYKDGALDIDAYLRFALEPLTRLTLEKLLALRESFIAEIVKPIIAPGSTALLNSHRQQGDILVIITATNRFVTAPIASLLGVSHLLASEPEFEAGSFSGDYLHPPCFQAGKIDRLRSWMNQYRRNSKGATFYSDSHNDLPLLEWVDHPVATDPDDILRNTAADRGWTIISLRSGSVDPIKKQN